VLLPATMATLPVFHGIWTYRSCGMMLMKSMNGSKKLKHGVFCDVTSGRGMLMSRDVEFVSYVVATH